MIKSLLIVFGLIFVSFFLWGGMAIVENVN